MLLYGPKKMPCRHEAGDLDGPPLEATMEESN